jgi:hypothetical protein
MKNTQCRTCFVARKLTYVEKEKESLYVLEYGKKTDHQGKRKTHIVGPGIWRETSQTSKIRNSHGRT